MKAICLILFLTLNLVAEESVTPATAEQAKLESRIKIKVKMKKAMALVLASEHVAGMTAKDAEKALAKSHPEYTVKFEPPAAGVVGVDEFFGVEGAIYEGDERITYSIWYWVIKGKIQAIPFEK